MQPDNCWDMADHGVARAEIFIRTQAFNITVDLTHVSFRQLCVRRVSQWGRSPFPWEDPNPSDTEQLQGRIQGGYKGIYTSKIAKTGLNN